MAQELTVGEEEDPYKQGNGCQSRNGKGGCPLKYLPGEKTDHSSET